MENLCFDNYENLLKTAFEYKSRADTRSKKDRRRKRWNLKPNSQCLGGVCSVKLLSYLKLSKNP